MSSPTESLRRAAALLAVLWLSGCVMGPPPKTQPEPFRNVYTQDRDSAPSAPPPVDPATLPDAVPQDEPRSRYGNHSPYTVLGKTYYVLESARGYRATGIASWYGEKFHGHRTSSFEPFDMYAMSAAHRTLPLPSYVRVTNLDNGRSVVVRVNDRGPFHDDRIIDLSWAAASRLGYTGQGTARVEVEALDPSAPAAAPAPGRDAPGMRWWVQLGAFSAAPGAQSVARAAADLGQVPTRVDATGGLHRVQAGPWPDRDAAQAARDRLRAAGYPDALVVSDAAPAGPACGAC